MTSTQYKNVIDYTLTQLPAEADSLTTVREILRNCGTPLPQGTPNQILNTLLSDDYMGWNECTYRDAVGYANAGVVAIGVGSDSIMLIEPQTDKPAASDAVAASASKENRAAMVYYTYSSKSSTKTVSRPNYPWSFLANLVVESAKYFLGMTREELQELDSYIELTEGAWCVDFVRFCIYDNSMYYENVNIPDESSTRGMRNWFAQHYPSRLHEGISGIQPGDIVFVRNAGGYRHTGLASSKPDSNGNVQTINGNWGYKGKDFRVRYCTFPSSYSGYYIGSYAHPDYYR